MTLHTVYALINVSNAKIYIGQTKNFKQRQKDHLTMLVKNCHHNKALQSDFNIDCNLDQFVFKVLEEFIETKTINKRELFWMKFFNSIESGYNKCCNTNVNHSFGKKPELIYNSLIKRYDKIYRYKNIDYTSLEQCMKDNNLINSRKIHTGYILKPEL